MRLVAALAAALLPGSGLADYLGGRTLFGALTPWLWLATQVVPMFAWRAGWLSGTALYPVVFGAAFVLWGAQIATAILLVPRAERPRPWAIVLGTLLGLAIVGCGGVGARAYTAEVLIIPSAGMSPTLLPNDRVLVRLRHGEPVSPGQVVVYHSHGEDSVHRVVATEGQTVAITNGELFVDGVPATAGTTPLPLGLRDANCLPLPAERAIIESGGTRSWVTLRDPKQFLPDFPQVTVPPHSLFVLGDNRDAASDSRLKGYVGVDDVYGFVDTALAQPDPCEGSREARVIR